MRELTVVYVFVNPLDDWVEEWKLELDASTVVAGTTHVYLRAARGFLAWLTAEHPDVISPAQLTRKHVLGWYRHRAEMAEATRRRDGIALRLFLGYLANEPDSGLDVNPATGVELPTPDMKPVEVISDEDLSTLLKSMAGNGFTERRDTAIVRMLLDCGMRRAELVGIDLDDLNVKGQEVYIRGKGGRDRIATYGTRTTLALRKYLRIRATRPAATSQALFLSIRSSDSGSWRMTGGGVAEMIDRRCKAAGLGHVYPHMFRHTWAADLKGQGVHEDHLERLAGWVPGSQMSRRYGNAVAEKQAREVARRLARGDRV